MSNFENEITSEEMRILDINSEFYGVSRANLMKNAGSSIVECIKGLPLHLSNETKISIFCGKGGNGGDGFVASVLLANDCKVDVFLIGTESNIKSKPALDNFQHVKAHKHITISYLQHQKDIEKIDLNSYDIIIDAVLGTGLRSNKIREPTKTVLKSINSASGTKISVDVPSGLMDSGESANTIVNPKYTVALHIPKIGTHKFGGKVQVVDIGIPKDIEKYTGPGVLTKWQLRDKNSHKGQNGKLLIIGGSDTYHGAPTLAAKAALSINVDLVTLVVPKAIETAIRSHSYRFIVKSYNEPHLTPGVIKGIVLPLLEEMDAVLIGPGLGSDPETISAVKYMIENYPNTKRLVIDADGLKACSTVKLPDNCIVTPHAGEFAVITGTKLGSLPIKEKLESMKQAITNFNQNVVWILKGRLDIVAKGDKHIINDTGIPELTVGGTGDILAGLTAGLSCIIDNTFTAASISAFLLGISAELQFNSINWFFFEQIFEWIPLAVLEIRRFIREEENKIQLLRKRERILN